MGAGAQPVCTGALPICTGAQPVCTGAEPICTGAQPGHTGAWVHGSWPPYSTTGHLNRQMAGCFTSIIRRNIRYWPFLHFR